MIPFESPPAYCLSIEKLKYNKEFWITKLFFKENPWLCNSKKNYLKKKRNTWSVWYEIRTAISMQEGIFKNSSDRRYFTICFTFTIKNTVCSYHVTYAFQSESILYSCLNVKELPAQDRCEIWSLSDCNRTRMHNHIDEHSTI